MSIDRYRAQLAAYATLKSVGGIYSWSDCDSVGAMLTSDYVEALALGLEVFSELIRPNDPKRAENLRKAAEQLRGSVE